jgi:hypothetical protein
MVRHLVWLWLASIAFPMLAQASCGSEQCPIDLGLAWEHSVFSLDLSQQYIDQNQPRAGTHDVAVGAIPSPEDEVRTVNRITTLRAVYRPSAAWSLSAALPFASRYHEHIHNESGQPPERQRWSFDGVGDVILNATHLFGGAESSGPRYSLSAGTKVPTGVTDVPTDGGEQPEPPARPGDGAWSFLAGAGVEWKSTVRMPGGVYGSMPIRLSAQGRANGRGTDQYRVGSELQVHLGSEYPVTRGVQVCLSADARVRAKDDVGSTDAEPGNTGGAWTYLSPGIRLNPGGGVLLYGGVQLPVYRRVNGINLVSDRNFYAGITRAF